MKKLAVLLAAAPLLLCAPLASSADASSAGDPGAFVLSEAEVDQMARNTHDFNQAIAAGNAAAMEGTHGQLGTWLTDGLSCDDTNSLTNLYCLASRHVRAITFCADTDVGFTA